MKLSKESAQVLLGLVGSVNVNLSGQDADNVWEQLKKARDELKAILETDA